jgi:DNA-binding transcriptional LysR family regulator
MALDIRRLKHFIATAEFGNINRAADNQGITQPALTRSIQVLEEELGVKLFERTPRGVTLTTFGKRLFDHARRIVNTASVAQADMEALISGAGGELRVGVMPSVTTPALMSLLLNLPKTSPQLTVSVTEMFYDSLIQLLRFGDLDLVIATLPDSAERSDLEIEIVGEAKMRMSILISNKHPLCAANTLTPESLQRGDWVGTTQPHYLAMLHRYFERQGMTPPSIRLFANPVSVLQRAVLQENYIALLSEKAIQSFPQESVTVVPNSTQTVDWPIGLVTSANVIRSAAYLRLREQLARHFSETQDQQTAPADRA